MHCLQRERLPYHSWYRVLYMHWVLATTAMQLPATSCTTPTLIRPTNTIFPAFSETKNMNQYYITANLSSEKLLLTIAVAPDCVLLQ